MRVNLKFLELHFRKSVEHIEFDHVNFFWGKIGAGKSSIARLLTIALVQTSISRRLCSWSLFKQCSVSKSKVVP